MYNFYNNSYLIESMYHHIGETVIIFTAGGRINGFTGILAAITPNCIKLITDIGKAPSCKNNCCNKECKYNSCHNNWIGSVTEIPINAIVCFTHHAI